MANNFDSNFSRKLMRSFLDKFESERVLTKNVDTQLFAGKFNGSTGDTIDVKRPTDYVTRTPAFTCDPLLIWFNVPVVSN